MDDRQVRRRERWILLALLLVALIPPTLMSRQIERERALVTFLRWIDDQAGIVRGDWSDPLRSEAEAALYREVVRAAREVAPDFEAQDVAGRWRTIGQPRMGEVYGSFQSLLGEGEVHIQGVVFDWTNSDVSANVGALLIGFRHAVADLMWLQVAAAWENGLINRMLPLMKTVVGLDPQFLEAYSLGSWHLAYNVTYMEPTAAKKRESIEAAIGLLEDGLRRNPRSSQLYEDLGYSIYFRKLVDYEQAEVYLSQGMRFEPHEPRMERAAALALERQRMETEALDILLAFDEKHPTWIQQKISIERLNKKLAARALEAEGEVAAALARWQELNDGTIAESVAPMEEMRLQATVHAQELETAGKLTEARATLMQARSRLPDLYRPELNPGIQRLTDLLAADAE